METPIHSQPRPHPAQAAAQPRGGDESGGPGWWNTSAHGTVQLMNVISQNTKQIMSSVPVSVFAYLVMARSGRWQ